MLTKTRIIAGGGTLLCAAGIGFFMQSGTPQPAEPPMQSEPLSRSEFQPLSEPVLTDPVQPVVAASMSGLGDSLIPGIPLTQPVEPVAADPVVTAALGEEVLPEMPSEPAMPAVQCDVTSAATVEAGAMVRFIVDAPCLANERAVIHHNGMMFTAATDEDGLLEVAVPALSELAVLMVEFENGDGSVATAEVSSLPFYDRVVLQWTGDTGFQLHAREFGSDYGQDGHVWAGARRDVTAAALGEGGFVTRLGLDDTLLPRMVEVYTFPTGTASRAGEIALSVEAEVTPENCGKDIEAQSMQLSADGVIKTQYLTLAVSDCSTVGDFLVLNNLMDNLKIAAN